MPQISVIVPVYKVEEYLSRCIDSILNQTYSDFELILVDDGSPDRCPEICDEYAKKDERIKVIHKENGGLSDARNAGLDYVFESSDSEWVSFVDSDDWITKKFLEKSYEATRIADVKIVRCRMVSNTVDKNSRGEGKFVIWKQWDLYVNSRFDMSVCSKLFKKELFLNVRFPIGKLFEDAFVIHRLYSLVDLIADSDIQGYVYCDNPGSITRKKWHPKRMDEFDAYDEQLAFFKKNGFVNVYKQLLVVYCHIIERQYLQVVSCDLPKHEKDKYIKLLGKRMRYLIGVLKAKVSIKSDPRIFEIAYPLRMRFYWYVMAILKKIVSIIA